MLRKKWKYRGYRKLIIMFYIDFLSQKHFIAFWLMVPAGTLLYSPYPHQPALYKNTVSFSSAGQTHSSSPAGEANTLTPFLPF